MFLVSGGGVIGDGLQPADEWVVAVCSQQE